MILCGLKKSKQKALIQIFLSYPDFDQYLSLKWPFNLILILTMKFKVG